MRGTKGLLARCGVRLYPLTCLALGGERLPAGYAFNRPLQVRLGFATSSNELFSLGRSNRYGCALSSFDRCAAQLSLHARKPRTDETKERVSWQSAGQERFLAGIC